MSPTVIRACSQSSTARVNAAFYEAKPHSKAYPYITVAWARKGFQCRARRVTERISQSRITALLDFRRFACSSEVNGCTERSVIPRVQSGANMAKLLRSRMCACRAADSRATSNSDCPAQVLAGNIAVAAHPNPPTMRV
jgi:hypothetical protein